MILLKWGLNVFVVSTELPRVFFQLSNYFGPSIGALMFTFPENVTVSLSSQDHENPKKCFNCFEFFFDFLL